MAKDWTTNAMLAERNRLAKMLNMRILRLERAGIDFGAISQYKEWIEEYYGVSKTGLLRFPEKRTAKSGQQWKIDISLRRELDKLEFFAYQPELSPDKKWKTQTVSDARKYISDMRSRFKAMGLSFPSDNVMLDFLKSESWKTLKKIYGSALAIRLAGKRKFSKGTEGRRSTVEVMDAKLQDFLKRMGSGYDLNKMDAKDIQEIFGIKSVNIIKAIEES